MTPQPKQRSIAQELLAAAQHGGYPNFGLTPTIKIGHQSALAAAVDNGNDALKGAIFDHGGQLVTTRIPAAYKAAAQVRAGKQELTYRIDGQAFWIGEVALDHEGEDLPIGPTRQRLRDLRMRNFMAAGLVELLYTAGYGPGEYTIVLGFAIPNGEIEPIGESDQLGVNPLTKETLQKWLKGAEWSVDRLDHYDGTWEARTWTIRILTVLAQAQTAGTVLVTTKAANGKTVTDINAMKVIDIGGGDLQATEVRINPYQMISDRLGDGTIRVARALAQVLPKASLNDVAAQQALITRSAMWSGRRHDISAEVDRVLAAQGQGLMTTFLENIRQSRNFITITGGGVILMHDQLVALLDQEGKVRGEDYELINHGVSSVLNAVGALFALYFVRKK